LDFAANPNRPLTATAVVLRTDGPLSEQTVYAGSPPSFFGHVSFPLPLSFPSSCSRSALFHFPFDPSEIFPLIVVLSVENVLRVLNCHSSLSLFFAVSPPYMFFSPLFQIRTARGHPLVDLREGRFLSPDRKAICYSAAEISFPPSLSFSLPSPYVHYFWDLPLTLLCSERRPFLGLIVSLR